MITSLRLQNFKGHADTTVSLGRLTVLVGPNGSGKTSVLQALRYLGQLADGREVSAIFSGEETIEALRAKKGKVLEPLVLEIQMTWQKLSGTVQGTATLVSEPQFPVHPSRVELRWVLGEIKGKPSTNTFSPKGAPSSDEQAAAVAFGAWRELIRTAIMFRFDARLIAAPASSKEPAPRIEFDGRNTAVVLKALKLGYDDLWATFREKLKKIVPGVTGIGVEQVEGITGDPQPSASSRTAPDPSGEWYRIFFDFEGAKHVSAFHASDGTLITVALLAVLLGPSRPRVVLLDDIEQTLHPTAQMELVRQLKALLELEEMRDVQIVATTHSPYILDGLDFDQVRVFALRKDGSVACKSLGEHPDAERLRGTVSAGELWSADPEWKWVAGDAQ